MRGAQPPTILVGYDVSGVKVRIRDRANLIGGTRPRGGDCSGCRRPEQAAPIDHCAPLAGGRAVV